MLKNVKRKYEQFLLTLVTFVKNVSMKIILSPAKSIDTQNIPQVPEVTVSPFLKESEKLINKLKKLSVKKLEAMMHISKDLAELNYNRFQEWKVPTAPASDIVPAVMAFNGEVYKGLDARSFEMDQMQKMQEKVLILSGLYGILKPLDLVYPYRLEMGTKWAATPKQKNLYQFWGTKLSSFLNASMASDETLINLASIEYSKAIDKKTLKSKMITPVFKEFKNGEYKIVMMYAKHARGAMARHCVINDIHDPEELKLYNVDGYTFDVNQSTESEWVFVR